MEKDYQLRMPRELITRQAEVLCEDIARVIELMELAKRHREMAAEIEPIAERLALSVGHRSMVSGHLFRLAIKLAPDTEAQVLHDNELIVENPHYFEATDVRKITKDGAVFFDANTENSLQISGHQFEVNPLPAV